MTRYLKDYDDNFNALKKITIGTLLSAFVLAGGWIYYVIAQGEASSRQVYVVTDMGSFSALRKQHRDISVFEVRNVVKTFLHAMFAHHAGNYHEQVERGLQLIDPAGGQRIVHDFAKGEVYENYVRLGTRTTMEVDSVGIDMHARPIAGMAFARQTIHLGENKKEFPIGIRFEITQHYRSEQNPYGLLLQAFDFIPYRPKTQNPKNHEN